MRLSLFVYRLALRFLPLSLRDRQGEAMERHFHRMWLEARARGWWPGFQALCAGSWDAVAFGVERRWGARRSRSGRHDAFEPVSVSHSAQRSPSRGFDMFAQDLKYALRSLRKSPRFTIVAIITLALGIGANSALFSVVNGVVLRPMPFPDADRFTHLAWDRNGGLISNVTPIKVEFWREQSEVFDAVATYRGFSARLGADGIGGAVRGVTGSQGYLRAVGFSPVLGRDFTEEENRPGGPDVTIVSDGFWKTVLGGDPDVIGSTVELDRGNLTVVGVLPPDFLFPQLSYSVEMVVPMRLVADPAEEGQNYPLIARISPDVSEELVDADLQRVYSAFASTYPASMSGTDRAMRTASYQDLFLGGLDSTLWILLAATGLVLLIACANVANLLLARGAVRRQEMAVRTALGASRRRLVGQIVSESLVLSLVSALGGLLLATWGVRALMALSPTPIPRMSEIGLDWNVFGFTLLAALVTGLLFGVMAALPSSDVAPQSVLRQGSRGGSTRSSARRLLIVGEAALSMVLLVGAGLLIATLVEILSVDAGFDRDNLVAVSFPVMPADYASVDAVWQFETEVIDRLGQMASVQGVAAASNLPLERGWNIPMEIEGDSDLFETAVEWRAVSPGYFETLRTDLVEGRTLDVSDVAGATKVAVVNRSFAEHYFPDESALGRRVEIGKFRGQLLSPQFEGAVQIVGVVEDMREVSLKADPIRTIAVPQAQAPNGLLRMPVFLIRSARFDQAAQDLRTVLADVDPFLPDPTIRPMSDVVSASLGRERFNAVLMALFAGLALVLTAFGIYGVVSYGVRRRTREIGVRIALGADRRSILQLVLADGMKPVLLGLLIGVVAALGLGRFIAGMIWGVSPTDPTTIAAVAGVLALVAAAASYLPGREAVRYDPVRSLRTE